MKAIHGYIRQSLAEHVIAELIAEGCHKMSVLDVRGVTDVHAVKDMDYSVALAQRIEHLTKLEIIASDADAERWAALIAHLAKTGRPGDGLVCILPVDIVLRIDDAGTSHGPPELR